MVAVSPTHPAPEYEENAETKVEQNIYLNMIDNNMFQRSTKIVGLPAEISPTKVDDLAAYFPAVPKFFNLDKAKPVYAAHQVCYFLWDDIEMELNGVPASGMLQIKYASKTDCQAHNVIPLEAEFGWKVKVRHGNEWDIELLQNSHALLEYISTSNWRHQEDVI